MDKTGIFIDLDGTLINSRKEISFLDKETINNLKDKYNIYLITGKSLINSIKYYNELNLNTKIVTSMGQVITNPSNKNFNDIVVPTNITALFNLFNELKKYFKFKNYLFESINENYYVMKKEKSNMINLICHNHENLIKHENKNAENIIGSYIEIEKVKRKKLLRKFSKINEKYKDVYNVAFWVTDGNLPIIQIKPSHVGKSKALIKVKEMDNLKKTIAIGNGWSDRNMLKVADIGIAMKNSNAKIKTFANFVSSNDNNNSGVAHELIKILKP